MDDARDRLFATYESLLADIRQQHQQTLVYLEAFHQQRYEELLHVLQDLLEVFEGIDVQDLLTLTATEQAQVALVLQRAWRYVLHVQDEP